MAGYGEPWTEEEIAFLKENYGAISSREISRRLKRTPDAILNYAKKFNIEKKPRGLNFYGEPRKCKICGTEFIPKTHQQAVCDSEFCKRESRLAYQRKGKEERRANKELRIKKSQTLEQIVKSGIKVGMTYGQLQKMESLNAMRISKIPPHYTKIGERLKA